MRFPIFMDIINVSSFNYCESKQTMEDKKQNFKLLDSYLAGNVNGEGDKGVENLFCEGENNKQLKSYVANDWDGFNGKPRKDINYILDRVHHQINLKSVDGEKSTGKKIYLWYSSVAAAVLIPLMVFAGFQYFSKKTGPVLDMAIQEVAVSQIYAPMNARVQFELPDGTKGWLNSGSSLEYSVPFKNNREIKLKGEAYLDVAHDAAHPFSVDVKGANVKVLGTKLNINGYPDEDYIEVVLEEGKVEFTMQNSNKKAVMKPSEKIVFQNGEIVSYMKTDAQKYTSWKDGKLIFRGDPMEEVARRIERWFNVNVVLADDELKNYSFRATFEDDSLAEVLKLLSMTSPIKYKIIEREARPDGSFGKTQIILNKQ